MGTSKLHLDTPRENELSELVRRALLKTPGRNVKVLAKQAGVSTSTIYAVLRGGKSNWIGTVGSIRAAAEATLDSSPATSVMPLDSTLGKVCVTCGERRGLLEFSRDRANEDGFKGQCKHCVKERMGLAEAITVPPNQPSLLEMVRPKQPPSADPGVNDWRAWWARARERRGAEFRADLRDIWGLADEEDTMVFQLAFSKQGVTLDGAVHAYGAIANLAGLVPFDGYTDRRARGEEAAKLHQENLAADYARAQPHL